MAISSIGVGSGLPLGELLESLRSSQQAPLHAIQARQAKTESRISGYGQLKNELDNLAQAAKALEGDAFETLKTTVVGSDFTATAKTGAIEVSYDVEVTSLARAQSLVTAGVASRSNDNGEGGIIKITIGDTTHEIDMTGKGTSLNDVVAAINASDDMGVRASVINNGGQDPYQLMITAQQTGTDAAITAIEVSGNNQMSDILLFGSAGSTMTEREAKNAELTVNGVAITSQTNTVSQALEGVTLTLTGASDESNKLTVENDVEAVTASIEKFVNTYNDVHKKIKQLTTYDVEAQTGAALVGDSIPRSIQTRLASILNTTSDGPFAMLSSIGIRTQEGGLLGLDKAKLADAMDEDMAGVKALFMGENGVAKRTQDITKVYTDNYEGILTKSQESANKALDSIRDDFERATLRIDAQMEIYRKQFTAMDSLVAQMNSTSAYLAQQLANLGVNNKS